MVVVVIGLATAFADARTAAANTAGTMIAMDFLCICISLLERGALRRRRELNCSGFFSECDEGKVH